MADNILFYCAKIIFHRFFKSFDSFFLLEQNSV